MASTYYVQSSPFNSSPPRPRQQQQQQQQQLQKRKMSLTQTYYLAHTARGKLSREAARADHDLRLLVGHANLLDSLMLELANAEKEQERWFNRSVNSATKSSQDERPSHIRWADNLVEEPEEDWSSEEDSDAESDMSDSDLEEEDMTVHTASATPFRRPPSPVAIITEQEVSDSESDTDEEEEEEDEDFEFEFEDLALRRSPSRQSPPELLEDLDDDSEEDTTPPSPPQSAYDDFTSSEKEPSVSTMALYHDQHPAKRAELALPDSEQSPMFGQGYYVSSRLQGTMIPAY
ncbi:hypothetical protein VTN96DRAFT_896 [Rasamsonia emersonii]|uniref:Uncharacterized protein n=1 Tax=Rasamsonia emersonii (strain ATCC 16479 / CBS 393.64 / IMI 116815) TaxID=1408163 RepID=A0A0F4YK07_RASE3|nr:hypothetical protein T310_7869 [Rasamsonia emersonii CBS 393.64]KKA18186.1 hypothetical protein T310_7869 [Rasamsonia emersonii CBS 393.64]